MVEKERLRKEILAERDRLDRKRREVLSKEIYQHFVSYLTEKTLQTFFIYLHFGSEVETTSILYHLLDCSKTVAVPRTDKMKKSMDAVIITRDFIEVPGAYGISEPAPRYTDILYPSEIDCVILPGAVFDRQGGRIGYGGGYYDIFLHRCREDVATVGVAFSLQVKDHIPQEDHDVSLGHVITEKEILQCSRK